MSLDPRKVAVLRQRIASDLLHAQRAAAKRVRQFVSGELPDSDVPWNEVSGATRGALSLASASLAAERAKTMSEAPRGLGVIVIERRLSDTPENRRDWEAEARQLNEARAIEAVPVVKEVAGG
jgi:hypothetical protein